MLSACFAAVDMHQTRRARISKPKFFRRLQVRIMPGFGRVKWGKALRSDCVINVATTRCFNTGDRMEIRVKAVHSECEGKRKGRKTLHHPDSQQDAAGCHSKKEALRNFSMLHQTYGGQRWGGETRDKRQVLAKCFWEKVLLMWGGC